MIVMNRNDILLKTVHLQIGNILSLLTLRDLPHQLGSFWKVFQLYILNHSGQILLVGTELLLALSSIKTWCQWLLIYFVIFDGSHWINLGTLARNLVLILVRLWGNMAGLKLIRLHFFIQLILIVWAFQKTLKVIRISIHALILSI